MRARMRKKKIDHTMLQYCSDDEENKSEYIVPCFGIDDDEWRMDMKVIFVSLVILLTLCSFHCNYL